MCTLCNTQTSCLVIFGSQLMHKFERNSPLCLPIPPIAAALWPFPKTLNEGLVKNCCILVYKKLGHKNLIKNAYLWIGNWWKFSLGGGDSLLPFSGSCHWPRLFNLFLPKVQCLSIRSNIIRIGVI